MVTTVRGSVIVARGITGTLCESASGNRRLDWYPGPYEATPTVAGSSLPTGGTSMREDVAIRPIPCVSASNQSGGRTVSIAS